MFEGPEALSFSRDVTLTLSRRTQLPPPPAGPIQPGLSGEAASDRAFAHGRADRDDALAQAALRWLARFEWEDDRLIGPPLPRGLAVQRIVTIEAARLFLERVEYRVVRRPAGLDSRGFVEAVFDRRRRVLPGDQPRMQRGDVLLAGANGPLLPPFHPPFPWPPRPVVFLPQPAVVLTNGDQTRGLVIPVNTAGDAISLPNGYYRFLFAIDRQRWRADLPDAASNYRAQATFDATW